MNQKYKNDTMFCYHKVLDENLVSPPTHTVNAFDLQSNKKSGNPPISTSTPPLSELSPLSSKIFGTTQVTQFLEGPALRFQLWKSKT